MRVWVYPERAWEELGAVRWECSWEEVRPSSRGKDEIDPDSDVVSRFSHHRTKEAAMASARGTVDSGETAYGQVTVTRQAVGWFVEGDRVAEWQGCEHDTEYVD